jgi:hypothetical protein
MNNDFSLGAFARFLKKPSNRHISIGPPSVFLRTSPRKTSSPANGFAMRGKKAGVCFGLWLGFRKPLS